MIDSDIIDNIFRRHCDYYESIGVETIKQQSAQFMQVSEAYQGRVVFELLQNAIDRAQKSILVKIAEIDGLRFLIVANDGDKFSYDSNYDYNNGGSNKRCDFQSLCSIATTSKDSTINIGNKGVGFKSVFSISHYADIYTNGIIMPQNQESHVDFRLYDLFNDSKVLIDNGLANSASKLNVLKTENDLWGIPGYYFPIKIENKRPEIIQELFNAGFVTIITVPISEDFNRVYEMRNFHYDFISERSSFTNKEIVISFSDGEKEFSKVIKQNSRIVSRKISEHTRCLGEKAHVKVASDASVSLCFRHDDYSEYEALVYNFLPTNVKSIFANVDINADFQTSVDRKDIPLSKADDNPDEPIGSYNRALLIECVRLYFDCLVDDNLLPKELFRWEHLQLNHSNYDYGILKQISEKDFLNSCVKILSVRKPNVNSEFDYYYDFIFQLIEHYHEYGCNWENYQKLARRIGEKIKETRCRFLPDTKCESDEIFLTKVEISNSLPSSLGVELSHYYPGEYYWRLSPAFRAGLGLRNYSDADELLKHFCQCDMDGNYSNQSFSDEEQAKILASILSIISLNNSNVDYSTKRIEDVIIEIANGREGSVKDRASFALSTVFYKTLDGKYKPGQLLRKCDIDPSFLELIKSYSSEFANINLLLQKTGVSFSKTLCYSDKRIYDSIGNGLSYCPYFYLDNWKINRSDSLKNIRVIDMSIAGASGIHPIAINENYSIFENISTNKDVKALGCADYENLTTEYADLLRLFLSKKCDEINHGNEVIKSELLRFYSRYAPQLFSKDIVISKCKGQFSVSKWNDSFLCVKNPRIIQFDDFEVPLLCYSKNIDKISPYYKAVTIKYFEENSIEPVDCDCLDVSSIFNDEDRINKVLYKISQSPLTEKNYYSDDFYNSIKNIRIEERQELWGIISIEGMKSIPHRLPYLREENSNIIYIEISTENKLKSQYLVSRAISDTIFGSEVFTDIVQLVMFSENLWIETKMNRTPSSPSEIDYTIETDSSQVVEKQTKDSLLFGNISLLSLKDYSKQSGVINLPLYESSISQKNRQYSGITQNSEDNGELGEKLAAWFFANLFCSKYKPENRKEKFELINNFLVERGFSSIPIEFDYTSKEAIAKSIWYTHRKENRYSHFDLVTFWDEKVCLVEIKSTNTNNIFRVSKKEAEIARKYPDNYLLCRVLINSCEIINYGNPLKDQLQKITDNGLQINAAGYDIITLSH